MHTTKEIQKSALTKGLPLDLYGSECEMLTKDHMGTVDMAEVHTLGAVAGFRRTVHKRNEHIREEPEITAMQ
jgi:hypothetical protein